MSCYPASSLARHQNAPAHKAGIYFFQKKKTIDPRTLNPIKIEEPNIVLFSIFSQGFYLVSIKQFEAKL
jgi:hypothetical protein